MPSLKRILVISVICVAGVLLTAYTVGYLYKDEVKNVVVQSLNQRLKTKIEVEHISFSLIRHFPYPSLTFTNVVVFEPNEFITSGQVLNAREIVLILSFTSLFNDNYSLLQVSITDALLNLQIDENGNANYNIWKSSDKTDESPNELNIDLKNVTFTNTDVLYYNIPKNQDISFLIESGTFKGNFKSEAYAMNASAKLLKSQVIIDDVKYLNKTDCNVELNLNVNRNTGNYLFETSSIESNGLKLSVEGGLTINENDTDFDLKISTPEADLPSLIAFIPEKYRGPTIEYNYSGRITFDCFIKGKSSIHILVSAYLVGSCAYSFNFLKNF